MKERLSEKSLEDLCVAITRLQTESGLITNLRPEDVLQIWVLEQLPVFTTTLSPAKNSGEAPPASV